MKHHASLYIGTFDTISQHLPEDVQKTGSDVRHVVCDRLTIDDARDIMREAVQRPVEKETRSFVLSFFDATSEAQNALLKTLEEPVATSVFYIIVPHREVLIPTVQSRLMTIDVMQEEVSSKTARDFFARPYKEKFDHIAHIAKEHDAKWIEEFLKSAEQYAREIRNMALTKALLLARKYISTSGASRKMLLEHVVLSA